MLTLLQKITPQRCYSRLMGRLAECRSRHVKNWAIRLYIKLFKVDMVEAEKSDYTQYATLNEFFTRHLKPGARPIPENLNIVISPIDGSISEIGKLDKNRLLQVKGITYDLENLLAGDEKKSVKFYNGSFSTFYLAPKNYHRIHMPITGRLLEMTHIPGKLFSVSASTVQSVPGIFARNERVICWFETEIGLMGMIAVGAMGVGSIVTSWHGKVTPSDNKGINHWVYQDQGIVIARGQEMGYFQFGSSVIVLFEENKIQWIEALKSGNSIKMGEAIGKIVGMKAEENKCIEEQYTKN